jgi:4-alpha-glucanotransferase
MAVPQRLQRRTSGILLHPTSLPGPGPIGSLGAAARRFVDVLEAASQRRWQVLPVGPTGLSGSPYYSPSAFAGNTWMLDPREMVERGQLSEDDAAVGPQTPSADFAAARSQADQLVRTAYARYAMGGSEVDRREFAAFCERESSWLRDYALYTALHERFGQVAWSEWPRDLAARRPEALHEARQQCRESIEVISYGQYLFDQQWRALTAYATERSVRLIGDIPIYVAYDSADVWAHQTLFDLDARGRPRVVAGVPPDYFSDTGQRWGNPLYRWSIMKDRGYGWWVERFRRTFNLFDLVRIDHFRGFHAFWEIPAGEETAINGKWVTGPGADLFEAVERQLGPLAVIAEDLGVITKEVEALRDALGFPGMKILQFAFDSGPDNPYLPENYDKPCVVYPGTHDNDTTVGWYGSLSEKQREVVDHYLDDHLDERPESPAWALIELAWRSPATMAVCTLQDCLALGSEARMNRPAQSEGNWMWRLDADVDLAPVAERLARLGRECDRDS